MIAFVIMVLMLAVLPAFVYPPFLMKALCFALFACAFNLLIGYVGLLSFGHALYFGWASYLAAHLAKVEDFDPVLGRLLAVGHDHEFPDGAGACNSARGRRRCRPRSGRGVDSDPPSRHLFRDDHARARADRCISSRCRCRSPAAKTASSQYRAAICSGCSISRTTRHPCMSFVIVVFLLGFLLIYRVIHSPFGEVLKAIPRKRTACDFARLQDRPLQASGVYALGGDRGSCRRDQAFRRARMRRLPTYTGRCQVRWC